MSETAPPSDSLLENIDYEKYSLSSLFDLGWKLQQELEKQSDESSSSYQLRRRRLIDLFQKCEFMLDELHIFSSNEELDEISTSELRYMMIYAISGWLYSKISSPKPQDRLPELHAARDKFHKYLVHTKNYGIHNFEIDKKSNNEKESTMSAQAAFDHNLLNQAYDRTEKIRRFKEQKELESQLANMYLALSASHIDDEQRRKCFKTFLRYWTNKSIDDLKIVNDEIRLLESFSAQDESQGAGAHHAANAAASNSSASKPYIITRDAIQAQVFGAGYPSLPVYSISQFYDQLADRGLMPKAGEAPPPPCCATRTAPVHVGGGVTDTQKDKEKAEKDELEDKDDEENLRKEREWDEFKDENKRGAGNRFNRS